MDKVRELAEALFANEISQFTPTGAGLFDNFIKYPHVTEEKRHFYHKLWLFRSGKLLEKAEVDGELASKIQLFLRAKLSSGWIEAGFELYKASKEEFPEVTESMVKDIPCCEVLNGK